MTLSTSGKAALLVVIALATFSIASCSPQRVLPTLPPPTPLATIGESTSAAEPVSTTPAIAATDTPFLLPTLGPTSEVRTPTGPAVKTSPTRAAVPTSGTMQIKLFFVAINDNGKTGKKIGCDDSLVAVNRPIPSTSAPLTAAIKELLGMHDQYYGQSGLYNALYQSKLQVAGVSITNAKATINLTGTMTLGGTCDSPRVAAQLQELALQFSTVKEVAINVNGVPLEQALSTK